MPLQQRRVATNFRDNALLNVFKVAMVALRYLLDNRADDKLKEQVGAVCTTGSRLVEGAHSLGKHCNDRGGCGPCSVRRCAGCCILGCTVRASHMVSACKALC
jgi:hypothetical protein